MFTSLESLLIAFGNAAWGTPLLLLLLGGGSFFLIYSRFVPFRYLGHAFAILRGQYDDASDPGEISHFQALSTALAATVGMGNISGVAVAISMGGPGAIFWMWVSAVVGMATKFFTCTLAIMYRGRDTAGQPQGGPMYVITEGLGAKWRPLAIMFAICGLFGCLPIFQANQLTQTIRDVWLAPMGWGEQALLPSLVPWGLEAAFQRDALTGLVITLLVGLVVFGGLRRIARVSARLVPAMVLLYGLAVLYILATHAAAVPASLALIFRDAFSGDAVMGGALGSLIITGVRRAAFSNEAGIGTAPLAHGAARTREPVREGLIAMLGPAIDTLVVCTLTALAIIVTSSWQASDQAGIAITLTAFEAAMPQAGPYILTLCVSIFSLTTLFSYFYYGSKCLNFLAGAHRQHHYRYAYVASILFGATASLDAAVGLIDGMFALMAIPTTLSALLLAPRVRAATQAYLSRMAAG